MLTVLTPSERSREYDLYSPYVRGQVAFEYLTTKSLGHREIDRRILGKDPVYTRGYQAMGILHYQGLYKSHGGKLLGRSIEEVIRQTAKLQKSDRLLNDLIAYRSSDRNDLDALNERFQKDIQNSIADDPQRRRARLALRDETLPRKVVVINTVFIRDPDVVAEALLRASGKCEECADPAPFIRKSDGHPYLEVHHKIPLARGGPDTMDNVLALCPNCHRKAHYG